MGIAKISKYSNTKKGMVTEQIPQGAELVSFDFSILRVILELYIAKLQFTGGLQIMGVVNISKNKAQSQNNLGNRFLEYFYV